MKRPDLSEKIEHLRMEGMLTDEESSLICAKLRQGKSFKAIFAVCAVLLLMSFCVFTADSEDIDESKTTLASPIMTVNGTDISMEKYLMRLEGLYVPVGKNGEKQYASDYVIGRLLSEAVALQFAQKEKVMPTPADINARIAKIKENTPDFDAYLKSQGMTEDEWKEYVVYQMALNNLVTKDVTVTEDDVMMAYDAALKQNPSPFITQPKVDLSIIVTKDQNSIEGVYNSLKGGASFGSVAEMKSEDESTKRQRGRMGWLTSDDAAKVPKILYETAMGLKTGEYSKPVYIDKKWMILYANEAVGMKVQSYASVKDLLKEQITIEKGLKSGSFQSDFANFMNSTKVTVYSPRYKEIYNNVLKKMQKNKLL